MDSLSLINGSSESKELAIGEDSSDVTLNHPLLELGDSTKFLGVQVVLILAYSTIILWALWGTPWWFMWFTNIKTLRTVTNFFIANLAVADLLVKHVVSPVHAGLHSPQGMEVWTSALFHSAILSRSRRPRLYNYIKRNCIGSHRCNRLSPRHSNVKGHLLSGHCHHLGGKRRSGKPTGHIQGVWNRRSFSR